MFDYINSSFDQLYSIRKFIIKYKIHIIIWSIFICYETVLAGLVVGRFGTFINYSTHYILSISTFYLFAHRILPLLLVESNLLVNLLFGTLLTLCVYMFAVALLDFLLFKYTDSLKVDSLVFNSSYWARNLWRACYFIGFSTGYFYLLTYVKQKKRATDLEREKLNAIIKQQATQAELITTYNNFLRVQINPHFLFNTLSFLHSNTRVAAPKVAKCILLLSDIMRYSLTNEVEKEVLLSEEIEHIKSLVELHKIRSEGNIYIDFYIEGNFEDVTFAPLVLLTLTENVFKHGVLTDVSHPAEIHINLIEDQLTIVTRNLISPFRPIVSHNLGVSSIKKFLDQKYPSRYIFNSQVDKHNYYSTTIVVNINEI